MTTPNIRELTEQVALLERAYRNTHSDLCQLSRALGVEPSIGVDRELQRVAEIKQQVADLTAANKALEDDVRYWNERFLAEQKLAMDLCAPSRHAANPITVSPNAPPSGVAVETGQRESYAKRAIKFVTEHWSGARANIMAALNAEFKAIEREAFQRGLEQRDTVAKVAPPSGVVVESSPTPGTGAWAWQQMQRGPEVWVRRASKPVSACYHMVLPGLIETKLGTQLNGTNSMALEMLWPTAVDWELCEAPANAAPQPESGPTREQMRRWLKDGGDSSDQLAPYEEHAMRSAWTAAREGMVPAGFDPDIGQRERSLITRAEKAEARVRELEEQNDRLRAQLKTAEARVGDALEVARAAEAERDTLRGELAAATETVKDIDGPTLNARIVALRTRNVELAAENSALRSDLAALRGEELTRDSQWVWETYNTNKHPGWRSWSEMTNEERNSLLRFANACRVRPERGRNLTDGERVRLHSLAYAPAPSTGELPTPGQLTANEQQALGSLLERLCDSSQRNDSHLGRWRDSIFAYVATFRSEAVSAAQALQRQLAAATDELTALRARVVLPLTDAQREELAKVAREAGWPAGPMHGYYSWDRCGADGRDRAFTIVDALVPRIARAGVRELTNSEIEELSAQHLPTRYVTASEEQAFVRAAIAKATGAEQ